MQSSECIKEEILKLKDVAGRIMAQEVTASPANEEAAKIEEEEVRFQSIVFSSIEAVSASQIEKGSNRGDGKGKSRGGEHLETCKNNQARECSDFIIPRSKRLQHRSTKSREEQRKKRLDLLLKRQKLQRFERIAK